MYWTNINKYQFFTQNDKRCVHSYFFNCRIQILSYYLINKLNVVDKFNNKV